MAKKYYWLKLDKDFFKNKEIKKLRKLAGGDTYTIIYLKLQLLSLKDEGKLYFEGLEENFAEEIALDLDEDADNVNFTLMYLQKTGLIEELREDEFLLTRVPNIIGKEGASAERARRSRLKEKEKALLCNTQVTNSNTEIEKEIEIEIDIEKEIEKDTTKVVSSNKLLPIIESWNSLGLQKLISINPSTNRYKMLNVRIRDYGIEKVIEAINSISKSDFLMGRAKDFVITFDWFVKPNNFTKVLEGNYVDKKSVTNKNVNPKTAAFVNFDGRPYTDTEYEDQERKLLGWDKED